jgi:hypothetical protein
MPAIVAVAQVVEEWPQEFGDALPNEPARVHFAEYATDLLIAERKTGSGIARVRRCTRPILSRPNLG